MFHDNVAVVAYILRAVYVLYLRGATRNDNFIAAPRLQDNHAVFADFCLAM